jgi:threonine dehydrogenase-like Zn-dependent dehydrogenase
MRALFAGGGGKPHFRDIPEPRIEKGREAIVRPLAVALCDLDTPLIANQLPMAAPYAVGHEFTAEVVSVGEDVTSLRPGDRVTVPFQISCGGCVRCRSARTLDCTTVAPLATYGLAAFGGGDWGGAIADLVRVPFADAMAIKLPDGADPIALASVSDNVADGYRCVAPHVRAGEPLLVLGSASVGLYAVAVAQALGVACTYVDTVPERLSVAARLGATIIDAPANGRKFGDFPVTAACISTADGLRSALKSTEPGGICQSAGIHFQPVELPMFDMYRRGVRLFTGRANARDDIPGILALVADGRLRPGDVTAQVVAVDNAVDALSAPLPHKTVVRM